MKYLFIKSDNHVSYSLEEKASNLFKYLENVTGFNFTNIPADDIKNEAVSVVYVATGGTAGKFKDSLDYLAEPIILVTNDAENSLSASMEMMTYLSSRGKKGYLLHGSKEEIAIRIDQILKAIDVKNYLSKLRLGLVGKPSDWLISTDFDYQALKDKTGIKIVEITMEELFDEIAKESFPNTKACRELMEQNFDKDQIRIALNIYGAFYRIVQKYELNGISVRCFDLLPIVKNTGCLGLALLNQEGIYGGCEGDVPSLISMAILGRISGKPVFMCNPSRINNKNNEIIFAHCTLPLNMPTDYKLDTHFESNIGVAISGNIPSGDATIFKTTGLLNNHFISKANIIESLNEDRLCRTQIRLSCDVSIDNFYNTPVGNHYIVCLGDYSEHLKEFFNLF